MAEAPITAHEIEQILSQPMEIIGDVGWQNKQNNSWYETTMKVSHPSKDISLEMRISVNEFDKKKYSFSLLLWGAHRIRALDAGGSHQNKHTDKNRWIQDLHKHKWTDQCHGAWAYSPDDILVRDIESAFRSFCDECGIRFNGRWHDPPRKQISLF